MQQAYSMITEIMHIDNTFDDLPVSDRKKQRQLVLSEKVDAYFAWARQKYSQVTHNSTIGKALAYSINQEEYLRVFLSDGMSRWTTTMQNRQSGLLPLAVKTS